MAPREEEVGTDDACIVTCPENKAFSSIEALVRGDGAWVRAAGPVVTADGETARSVAATVALLGLKEVLVLTHEGCRFLGTDTAQALDRVRARGVSRDALGADVRQSLGLIGEARSAAIEAASALRRTAQLPADTLVHAAVLRDGRIEIVERGAPPSPSPEEPQQAAGPIVFEAPPIEQPPALELAAPAAPPPLPKKRQQRATSPAAVNLAAGKIQSEPPIILELQVVNALRAARSFARKTLTQDERRSVLDAIDRAAARGAFAEMAQAAGKALVLASSQNPGILEHVRTVSGAGARMTLPASWGLLRTLFE